MKINKLRNEYLSRLPKFKRASENIKEAIMLLINQHGIYPQSISARVKDYQSFIEKCERKRYKNPFVDNTDFVGIRIIVFLPREIEEIETILGSNLQIIELEDKAKLLSDNEFGYRSHHMLAKIPKSWAEAPNYTGLGDIIFEIQIRTVLMHVWAEIEHKVQYKNEKQVPHELRRKLFLLSAKVEEADAQFEQIINDIDRYRNVISENVARKGYFDLSMAMDLNSFAEFLRFYYSTKKQNEKLSVSYFEYAVKNNLGFKELADVIEKLKPYENNLVEFIGNEIAAPAYLGYAIDIFHKKIDPSAVFHKGRREVMRKMYEIIVSNRKA